MITFDSIRDFIRNLDRKEMMKWSALYLGICMSMIIMIIIRHVMISNELYQKTLLLNKSRSHIQQILTKFQVVQEQKNKIDDLLNKNKTFNIQKFLQELIMHQNLTSQITKQFSHEKLPNGYIQESMAISCTQITTQQLCQFIQAIEQQPMTYITFVDITNMPQTKKINVSMTIATLQAEQ